MRKIIGKLLIELGVCIISFVVYINYTTSKANKEMIEQYKNAINDNNVKFKEIYDKYFHELYLYLHSVTEDSQEIEDILQDVFLKLLQGGIDISSISNVRGYVYFCARNALYNRLRDKANRKRIISEVFTELSMQSDEPDVTDTEALIKCANDAVERLPENCGEIFRMVKMEHKSYRQTAEAKGLSIKTIESQMGIALRKIREYVKKNLKSF